MPNIYQTRRVCKCMLFCASYHLKKFGKTMAIFWLITFTGSLSRVINTSTLSWPMYQQVVSLGKTAQSRAMLWHLILIMLLGQKYFKISSRNYGIDYSGLKDPLWSNIRKDFSNVYHFSVNKSKWMQRYFQVLYKPFITWGPTDFHFIIKNKTFHQWKR